MHKCKKMKKPKIKLRERRMNRKTCSPMNRCKTDGQTTIRTVGKTEGQLNRKTNEQMDGHMDR